MAIETITPKPKSFTELCSTCTACKFMPKQERTRVLEWKFGPSTTESKVNPLILMIDNFDTPEPTDAFDAGVVLFEGRPFSVTNTVRCAGSGSLTTAEQSSAISACAVWTGSVAEHRKLILSTREGLKQLKITGEYGLGDSLDSPRVGYILVVPDSYVLKENISNYKSKVNRLLKRCKL